MYADLGFYDIYILNPYTQRSIYHLYEVCKCCNLGNDAVGLINTWTEGVGFFTVLRLPPSFKGSFYNTSLTIGAVKTHPNLYVTESDAKGRVIDGTTYRSYLDLARMLNMKWLFATYNLRGSATWFALLRDLVTYYNIDVVGGGWEMNDGHRQFIDVSANTRYLVEATIISIEPLKTMPWFGLFHAFKWYTWLMIFISILSVGITLYTLYKYDPESSPDGDMSFGDSTWQTVVIICWDSIQIRRPPWPVCLLLSCYMPMAMLLVTFYMDGYTSTLTSPKHVTPPIDTFRQLNVSDMKILSDTKDYAFHMRKVLKNKGFTDISKRMYAIHSHDSLFPIFKKMQDHPDEYVFPYKEHFSQCIMRLHATGLIHVNDARFNISQNIAEDKYRRQKAAPEYITFLHMTGGYILLLAGYMLAALCHVITVIKFRLNSYMVMAVIHAALVEVNAGQMHASAPLGGRIKKEDDQRVEITEL